jgi:hypothetical protein
MNSDLGSLEGTIRTMRRLAGSLLLLLALVSSLPGVIFLLFSFGSGFYVRITEPPGLFVAGIVVIASTFWGGKILFTTE